MSMNVRWRMTRRLACALLVIDDFTGEIITGSGIRLFLPDQPHRLAVRKNDGYFVFLEEGKPIETICIEGPCYQKEIIDFSKRKEEMQDYTLKVRLHPKKGYPFSAGTTAIEGRAKPGSSFLVVCQNPLLRIKMLEDYKKQETQLVLFQNSNEDIEEKQLAIKKREKAEQEVFTILRRTEGVENSFTLKEPLLKDYKKTEAVLLPVYTAVADEKGYFVVPIRDATGTECHCSVEIDGVKKEALTLETGRITTVDFLDET